MSDARPSLPFLAPPRASAATIDRDVLPRRDWGPERRRHLSFRAPSQLFAAHTHRRPRIGHSLRCLAPRSGLYALLTLVGERALLLFHRHPSAPPHVHIGWHDHASTTKFQWTFLAFPLARAPALFKELRAFCLDYRERTGYANAYFVSYVMEQAV